MEIEKRINQRLIELDVSGWFEMRGENLNIDGDFTLPELQKIIAVIVSENADPAPEAIPPAGTIVAGSASISKASPEDLSLMDALIDRVVQGAFHKNLAVKWMECWKRVRSVVA